MEVQKMQIDYLFLDNETCQRCRNTEKLLDEVIDQTKELLKTSGIELMIHKAKIETRKDAIAYQFERSPTVLVNGLDIGFEQGESACDDCGELCGCEDGTTCRSWVFEGKAYDVPPRELLTNRILQGIFGNIQRDEKKYVLPQNLESFFAGKEKVHEEKQCCESTCCS